MEAGSGTGIPSTALRWLILWRHLSTHGQIVEYANDALVFGTGGIFEVKRFSVREGAILRHSLGLLSSGVCAVSLRGAGSSPVQFVGAFSRDLPSLDGRMKVRSR